MEVTTEFREGAVPAIIDVRIDADPPLLMPHEQSEQVIRVVREALVNATRHAGADQIVVCLEMRRDEVLVSVEDDGRGFDPEAPPDDGNGHFGLDIMRARAVRLGGKLSVDSMPGRGTRIALRWPVEEAAERR